MKQKKPTPKKKSVSSSLLQTKQREGFLVAFDMVGITFVGKVIQEDTEFLVLENIGALSFRPEALKGGQEFKLIASITHRSPHTKHYYLSRRGIRGMSFLDNHNLLALYQAFVERAERGDFAMNPYALAETGDFVPASNIQDPEIEAARLQPIPPPEPAKEEVVNAQPH